MHRFRTFLLIALACLVILGVCAVAASADHHVQRAGHAAKVAATTTSTVTEAAAFSARRSTVYVYITNTGAKYHRSWCRYLKYSKYRVTLKYAKSNGYTPCKVCRPPT